MRPVGVMLLLGQVSVAVGQTEPTPPLAATPPKTDARKPWRWSDHEHPPFQDWHTNADVQARMYDEACAQMQSATGIVLPSRIEVMLVPHEAFRFVAMETGAKDGSLVLDVSLTAAMQRLSMATPAPTQAPGDTSAEPADQSLPSAQVAGIYSPRHVKQMIWLNPDRTELEAAAALRHELIHAIQDDTFAFRDFFAFEGITADELWARQAIEEGYAVLVAPPAEAAAASSEAATPVATPDPSAWNVQLLSFFYGTGRKLVEGTARPDESRHNLLMRVFGHPPRTTREALHPELYALYLESPSALALPEPAGFVALRDNVLAAMSAAGVAPAWRSRLGEFGLQSILVALGLPEEDAVQLASTWRNDALVNGPTWRDSKATAAIWCLDTPDASERLAAAIGTLLEARGLQLTAESLRLREGTMAIVAGVGNKGNTDALIVRQGEAIGFLVGEDLAQVLVQLHCRP